MEQVPTLLDQAQAAFDAGDYQACLKLCGSALAAEPKNPDALLLRGRALLQTGEVESAIEALEGALPFTARKQETRMALSNALFAAGRIAEAREHGRFAISLDRSNLPAVLNLARQFSRHRLLNDALPLWQELARADPESADYAANLAGTLAQLGRIQEAGKAWTELADAHPDYILAWIHLGHLALGAGRYEEARACADKALLLQPDSVDANLLAGMANSEGGYSQRAVEHWQKVVALQPDHPAANGLLGLALQEQGRFDDAEPFLRKSIEVWPTNGLAYYGLARGRKLDQRDMHWINRIEAVRKNARPNQLELSYLSYALGKAYEDLGDYERSIRNYDEANRTAFAHWFTRKPWDRDGHRAGVDRMIRAYGPEAVAQLSQGGSHDARPVFIIGMIRSGTTLVEQIVSSHPDVAGGGELTFWHENAARILDPSSGAVDAEEQRNVAGEYLQLLERISPGAKRVTDKLPHNFDLAGMIHCALPKARFIHVKRDPADICFSIYATAYQAPPAFALDRTNIAFAYREYRRVMEHWQAVIPADSIFEVEYEHLATDPEPVIRRMIAFLGLEWNDACLSPEQNPRFVHTPSAHQVRRPVYTSSVGRWKHFEPWIPEFVGLA